MFLQRLGFALSGVDEFLIKSYAVWLHATVPFSVLISSLSGAVIKPFLQIPFPVHRKSQGSYTPVRFRQPYILTHPLHRC